MLIEGLMNTTQNSTDNLTLSCTFEGFPAPIIYWYHNGEMIINSIESESAINTGLVNVTSQFHLTNLMYEDRGMYECVATDGIFNNSQQSNGMVTVQGKNTVLSLRYTINYFECTLLYSPPKRRFTDAIDIRSCYSFSDSTFQRISR